MTKVYLAGYFVLKTTKKTEREQSMFVKAAKLFSTTEVNDGCRKGMLIVYSLYNNTEYVLSRTQDYVHMFNVEIFISQFSPKVYKLVRACYSDEWAGRWL